MGQCKAKTYTDNSVITHHPLVCFGGLGQPKCKYLIECAEEYNMHKTRSKKLKKAIYGEKTSVEAAQEATEALNTFGKAFTKSFLPVLSPICKLFNLRIKKDFLG